MCIRVEAVNDAIRRGAVELIASRAARAGLEAQRLGHDRIEVYGPADERYAFFDLCQELVGDDVLLVIDS